MIHNQVAGYTQTYANKMTYATVKASLFFSSFSIDLSMNLNSNKM